MDDYVGASRFQWSDYSLDVATRFRQGLSIEHRRSVPAKVDRPTLQTMMALDPSEAADSARTIAALNVIFPEAKIIPTGRAIYHPGVNDILANIDEGSEILSSALLLDDVLARHGEPHYAMAIAHVDSP